MSLILDIKTVVLHVDFHWAAVYWFSKYHPGRHEITLAENSSTKQPQPNNLKHNASLPVVSSIAPTLASD